MPAGNQHADALDVALAKPGHVAANPLLTKPQAGFFGAVAGVRSPLNRQSSRIANPFATQPVLGGQGATVVPPALQLQLAASTLGQTPKQRLAQTIANDATPGHGKSLPMTPATAKIVASAPQAGGRAARARALKTEKAFVAPHAADVQVPVRVHSTVGPYAGLAGNTVGVPVAATGPELLAAAAKATNLGVPFANLSVPLQDKITAAYEAATLDPTYKFDVPNLNRYTAKDKSAYGLPPTATDGDVIRAKYQRWNGQPNYLTGLLQHVPVNTLQVASAPVFLADALGKVAHEGVLGNLNSNPADLFGAFQGNWSPAGQLGLETLRQQWAFAKSLNPLHPHTLAGVLQRDPIGVATVGLAGTRLAGGAAGMAARTGAVDAAAARLPGAIGRAGARGAAKDFLSGKGDRSVVPAGYDGSGVPKDQVPAIPRGKTSGKLDERVAQAASDWLAAHSDFFGSRLEKNRAVNVKREQSRVADQRYRENVEPAVRAISRLPRPVRRAVLFARGQGVTEEQFAQHFETLAAEHRALKDQATNENELAHWRLIQHDLEQSAKDWRGVADKVAGAMTPDMQAALHLAVRASRAGEGFMHGQTRLNGDPILTDFTANRRAYYTMAKVRAKAGDQQAQEWLNLDGEAQALEKKLAAAHADPTRYERLLKRRSTILAERDQLQQTRLDQTNEVVSRLARVADQQAARRGLTPTTDAVEKILNRQGIVPRPEALRLSQMQGRAAEAFPVGDRILPSELEAANKHLRLLERKLRAAQGPATKRRLQAKIDEFTPIRDKMAQAPVGPEVRQLRAQAARAGVESRALGAAEKVASPMLGKAPRIDQMAHEGMARPVHNELQRALRQRDRLEAGGGALAHPGDSLHPQRVNMEPPPNARLQRLDERIARADPQTIEANLRAAEQRAAEAFAKVRNSYRAETRGPGNAVDPLARLDENDPLYFPHTRTNAGMLKRRIIGGQGGGKVNLDVAPNYGKRLGQKGAPFGAHMLGTGGVESSPAAFFGAAAAPARIASALEHLRNQMTQFSVKTHEGMGYDARKWVRLDVGKKGGESPLTAGARTGDPMQRHVDETAHAKPLLHDLMSKFHDEAGPAERYQATALHKTIPADGNEYVLVSRHAYDALQNDFLHGGIYDNAVLAKLQKGTQMWRWATLLARPAWLASNFAGNTIQAATGGAGPLSFARAAMPKYRKGGVIPARAENAGLFRNDVLRPASAGPAASALGKFGDMVANLNVSFENYTRRALYLRHAIPEARRRAIAEENGRIGLGFKRMNADLMPHLEKLGVEEQAAPRIVKIVYRWLGDFSRAKNTPLLDLAAPFHRWFEFITRLVTTMPVKTPGRALLIQRMGDMGIQEQNQQFGGFVPNSMVGSIPFAGGIFKSTQALNPYATVFQLLDPQDQTTHNPGWPGYTGLAQALNPAIVDLFETATGKSLHQGLSDLKNAQGSAVGPMNLKVLIHDLENSIPLLTALQGYDTSADSINPLSPSMRTKGTFAQHSIPAWMRAVGYFGGSVRSFDPRLNEGSSMLRLLSEEGARANAGARAKAQQAKK